MLSSGNRYFYFGSCVCITCVVEALKERLEELIRGLGFGVWGGAKFSAHRCNLHRVYTMPVGLSWKIIAYRFLTEL
jgi:hypothetical protein